MNGEAGGQPIDAFSSPSGPRAPDTTVMTLETERKQEKCKEKVERGSFRLDICTIAYLAAQKQIAVHTGSNVHDFGCS